MRLRHLLLLLAMLGVASCKQIIGIEEASLDPALSNAGTTSGTAGQASALTGGTAGDNGSLGGVGAGAGVGGSVAATGGVAGNGHADLAGAAGMEVAGAGGEASVPPSLCEQYCDAVSENCSGALAIYTSYEMCLAVCAVMPPGLPGDGDKNVSSVHCRLEAALAAGVSEPEYSCPIAAPGGNGGCGSNCENLCTLRDAVCSKWVMGNTASCLTACAKLDDLGSYTIDPAADPSHTRGGHVQCRLYHVSAAATDEPDTHCLHVDGASPCIER